VFTFIFKINQPFQPYLSLHMALHQTILIHGETSYPHYYLCPYLPLSTGANDLSLSLLKFKRGRQPDLNKWIDRSSEALTTNPFLPPDSILLRALHHDETSTRDNTPTSLDKLGKTLAARFHSHYCPRFLRKSHPTPEIKGLSKEQRAAELKNCYHIDPRFLPAPYQLSHTAPPPSSTSPTFLLVDDILTTGTTMQMIMTAILPSFPKADLVVFTLAKADYDN